MFDFRRITLFCIEKRLSKHKMAIFSYTFLGGMVPLPPWLRLWSQNSTHQNKSRAFFEESPESHSQWRKESCLQSKKNSTIKQCN